MPDLGFSNSSWYNGRPQAHRKPDRERNQMSHRKSKPSTVSMGEALILVLLGLTVPAPAGTWSPLAHTAPGAVNLMLLLPDGTVMGARNNGSTIGSGWFRLTPAANGSYINGTWTT